MLKATFIAVNIFNAFIFFNLGMDWVNFGHGLHPMLALPVATISFLLACFGSSILDFLASLSVPDPFDHPTEEEWAEFADLARVERQAKLSALKSQQQ